MSPSDDPPRRLPLEAEVKKLAERIKKSAKDGASEEDLKLCVSKVCSMAVIVSRESKLIKPLIRALSDLEKLSDSSRCVIREVLTKNHVICRQGHDGQLTLEYLQFWSQMIEGTEVGKEVVGEHLTERFLDACFTINNVLRRSDAGSDTSAGTMVNSTLASDDQALVHACVKFLIQLYQNFKQKISERMYSQEKDSPDNGIGDVQPLLVRMLKNSILSKDSVFLAATCLVFHLSCHSNKAHTVQEFLDIYSLFNSPGQIVNFREAQNVEGGKSSTGTKSSDRLARVALVNGMLSCAEHAHLWQMLSGSDGTGSDSKIPVQEGESDVTGPNDSLSVTLLEWMFYEAIDLCQCGEWQFHAFSLLQLWYSKSTKYEEKLFQLEKGLFCGGCEVMNTTLDLVWTQIDSPVDGVTECISHVYKLLLALHVKATSRVDNDVKEDTAISILDEILNKALQMAWHVKSKHALVSGLMTYVPVAQLLRKEPNLGTSLLDCMSTNFLAPAATQVFTSLLKNADLTDAGVREELSSWIRQGLLCEDSLRKHNVNHLWLPACMKYSPQLFHDILKQVETSVSGKKGKVDSSELYMLTSLLKSARMHNVTVELPVETLRLVLYHVDDDLRLDGLALTCVTPKKSESLSDAEISLLQGMLPYNMNNDSAPFRQQVLSHLRTVLVRSRDSVLSALKDTKAKEEVKVTVVDKTLLFLDWFWRLCIDNLHPGASYQRLKTCLDWISVFLDTMTFQPGKHQKKGNTPQNVARLLEVARGRQLLDLHTDDVVRRLLSCLLHGTDEIREGAGEVLYNFMPWPLPLQEPSASSDVTTVRSSCYLLVSALNLCDNPKAYESEAGALLVKLLFSRLVVDRGEIFQISRGDSGKHEVYLLQSGTSHGKSSAPLHFISQLVSLLRNSRDLAKYHVIQAATTCPGHGLVLAIQRCIAECQVAFIPESGWRECIKDLLEVSVDLLTTVLKVLGSSLEGEGVAPSFEEMGLSVLKAVAESSGDTKRVPTEQTILTSQQQLVMTWCWVNIRQISVLLGSLVERLPLGHQGLLDDAEVQQMAQVFVGVLTRCRHRGAIEGCNVGFMKFCTRLLSSKNDTLRQVPGGVLRGVLEKVRSAGSDASITRRSAGLPLIVQSIVASEGKAKQHALLIRAIDALLGILSDPKVPGNQTPGDQVDQTRDLPHVHALNILRAVFREASVAGNAQPHVASTAIHAIDGFASPIWAVQNGAMQLFSTLLQRMLGQKKTKDDHLNTMMLQDFFVHYPALQPYLLQQLSSAVECLSESKLHLNPTLYPVLTILSKLSAGVSQFDALDDLRQMVLGLAGSAILAVRELAAAALPALIPKQDLLGYLWHLASKLPETNAVCCNHNALHGTLLQIERLMHELPPESVGYKQVELFANLIYSRKWIGSESNACAITRAAYIRLIQSVHRKSSVPFPKDVIMVLYLELEMMMSQETPDRGLNFVGFDQYVRELVKWRLEMKTDTMQVVQHILGSRNWDLILPCLTHIRLNFLRSGVDESIPIEEDWGMVQKMLFKHIQRQDIPWELFCEMFECLICVSEHEGIAPGSVEGGAVDTTGGVEGAVDFAGLWERMNALLEQEHNSRLAGYAVKVMAFLLRGRLNNDGSFAYLKRFCDVLLSCSDPTCAHHLRKSCAHALRFVGTQTLEFLQNKQQEGQQTSGDAGSDVYDACLMKLIDATETLLVDEDSDIRNETARFVSLSSEVSKNSASVIHPNIALERMQSWTKFCDTHTLLRLVLKGMKSEENTIEVILRESKTYVDDLFAPEEVNPFRERAVLHAMRAQYEGCAVAAKCDAVSTTVRQELREISQVLEEVSELLPSLCVSPLNVTCNKWVFDALWGMVQRCKICLTVAPGSENRTMVLKALKKLKDIPHIHPNLQEAIREVCN